MKSDNIGNNTDLQELSLLYNKIQTCYKILEYYYIGDNYSINCDSNILTIILQAQKSAKEFSKAVDNYSRTYEAANFYDNDLYTALFVGIIPLTKGLYKLNILLFNNLLVGDDIINKYYMEDK